MSATFDSNRPKSHYRTELNNFLQVNGGSDRLRWEMAQQGPRNEPTWTAICYIDGIEYARGSGDTLAEAKERAAHGAHRALLFDGFRQRAGMALAV